MQLAHLRLGRGIRALRAFQLFFGGGIFRPQRLLAAVFAFGVLQRHAGRHELRLIGFQLGLIRVQRVELGGGIDFGDEVALFHMLPELHV